jgi:phosphatidylglycerophosphatase A
MSARGRLLRLIGRGFGAGLSPRAPGTVGTLVAIPPYLLLAHLPLWAYALLLLTASAVGVAAANALIRHGGREDPPEFVWDEIVGFWLTMLGGSATVASIALGFVLFRLFDIWKPWPVRWADRSLKGGVGAMADDLFAGVMAALALAALHHFGEF